MNCGILAGGGAGSTAETSKKARNYGILSCEKAGTTAENPRSGVNCGIISCLGGLCYGGNQDEEQDCGTNLKKVGKTTAEAE